MSVRTVSEVTPPTVATHTSFRPAGDKDSVVHLPGANPLRVSLPMVLPEEAQDSIQYFAEFLSNPNMTPGQAIAHRPLGRAFDTPVEFETTVPHTDDRYPTPEIHHIEFQFEDLHRSRMQTIANHFHMFSSSVTEDRLSSFYHHLDQAISESGRGVVTYWGVTTEDTVTYHIKPRD